MTASAPAAAFDALADEYDDTFSNALIGGLMRARVHRRLDRLVNAGDRLLESNCGTGVDAVALARRGVLVTATDVSPRMVSTTLRRATDAGVTIDARVEALETLDTVGTAHAPFDAALSNFGGLNCVDSLTDVARVFSRSLRPGAPFVACVMGPVVPWEWVWFVSHGEFRRAFRRLRRGGATWRGVTIRYPSVGDFRRAFEPWFEVTRVWGLGALVPPPYTERAARRVARLVRGLDRVEQRIESLPGVARLSDHYVVELRRRSDAG